MMRVELWQQIRELYEQLGSIRAVAKRLGVHRKTVREAIRSDRPPKRTPGQRGSIIDPYRGWILAKLEQYPELTAKRILHMLTDRGYTGGYSVVKQCVAELRPRLKPAYFTLKFAPGQCAQVDWGSWRGVDVQGGRRRISFFTMVLCYSRMLYVELFMGQAAEHWLSAHRNAFNFFGAVPRRVMVDNCKTAVITPGTADQAPVFNPSYADFAAHYGFKPVACTPGRPNEKGRVENAVGYVKSSFLAGREPSALPAMAPAVVDWLETVANVRKHGTTGKRPLDLFVGNEKAAMLPLPPRGHPCAVVQQVVANNRFRVRVDTNRYSVPATFASQRLTLERCADRIAVYAKDRTLIADHRRCYNRGQDILDPDHERPLLLRTQHTRDRRLLERFLTLGSAAEPYLAGLREKRPDWKSHLRRINALAEIHDRNEVARLLADALEHRAFSSEYVLNILEARQRAAPQPGPLHVTRRQDLLELDLPEPDLDIYGKEQ